MHSRGAFLVCLSGCSALFGLDEVVAPPPPDAVPDARPPVMGCTPVSLVHEEFDAASVWFPTVTGSALLANGALRVVIVANDSYVTISGERFYDLRDDQLTYEITDTGLDSDSSIEVRIDADPEDKSWLQFYRTGTKLLLQRASGDGLTRLLAMVDYVPAMHRFLRFKHSGTQVLLQTSGTGTNDFVDQVTAFDVEWAATARPRIVLHRGKAASMFDVSLHSVHGGSSPIGACPIRQLQETFDGDSVAPLWKRSTAYAAGTVSQSGGAIELANMPDVNLSATIAPLGLYDLTNASITIDIEQMFETAGGLSFELGFQGLGGRAEILKQEMGTLSVEHYDGSVVATKPYVAASMRFWRITTVANKVTWATSGDGVTFDPVAETTGHLGLDRADIFLRGNGMSSAQTSVRISSITGGDAP